MSSTASMSSAALPKRAEQTGSLLRSFAIFNPTLSRGNEEKAMDNIIFYHPKTDDNNKKMNTVGFCVACACICERFAVRNDNLEIADEIQTDGSVTVLFSPQRELWVTAEVDPSIDTLSMRLIMEKAVGSFFLLNGYDALSIEAPPHKRYIMGSDPEYEKRLEASEKRKTKIEIFFRDFIGFLTRFALVALPTAGPNHTFRIRAAADGLIALPTVIPSMDAAAYLRFDTLCARYQVYLTASDEDIRESLIGTRQKLGENRIKRQGHASENSAEVRSTTLGDSSSSASALSTPIKTSASKVHDATNDETPYNQCSPNSPVASYSFANTLRAPATDGQGNEDLNVNQPVAAAQTVDVIESPFTLQFVIGCVDDCRLLYSSAPDLVSHKLLFLARTQIQLLELHYKKKVSTIHYTDSRGNLIEQPMIFAHRSGFIVFILGKSTLTEKARELGPVTPETNACGASKQIMGATDTSQDELSRVIVHRLALLSDMLVCIEMLANFSGAYSKACELRSAALGSEYKRITEALVISGSRAKSRAPSTVSATNSHSSNGSSHHASSWMKTENPAISPWAKALRVPLVAPKDTALSSTLFSPSPLALMSCLADGPIVFTPRSPRGRLYPCTAEPLPPIPRCSDTQPTVVGFNRGFAYGSPLASLPRSAQMAIAHYMGELWRNHYASFNDSTFNFMYQNKANVPSPSPVMWDVPKPEGPDNNEDYLLSSQTDNGDDDETIRHFNQHYRHVLVNQINNVRFHGRVAQVTDGKLSDAPSLTLPTLLVDGEKDISDIWIPIIVRQMGSGGASSAGGTQPSSPSAKSAGASPPTAADAKRAKPTLSSSANLGGAVPDSATSTADESLQYGVALLAIAQFNGRVVAVYFPPRSRQSFIEQLSMASSIFSTAFRGSGFI